MSPKPQRAFTLIEIMIVVAIMGIVMAMSVPFVYKVWRKAPMRKAVKDIVEVCSHARARAIMQGTITEVVFHPKENRLELAGAGSAPLLRTLGRASDVRIRVISGAPTTAFERGSTTPQLLLLRHSNQCTSDDAAHRAASHFAAQ